MHDWNPLTTEDDGLETMPIKRHSLEKYSLVKFYAHIFAKAMRSKWDNLAYIDLFSGPGVARVEQDGSLVETPALSVLKQEVKFDTYIFCEKHKPSMSALQARAAKFPTSTSAYFLEGDSNEIFPSIVRCMPKYSRETRVLTLCYVDPFKLSNLKFSTIEALSKYYIDFLVLVPTHMDANRNLENVYSKEGHRTVEEFIGKADWRERYELAKSGGRVETFILDEFVASMTGLRYIKPPESSIRVVKHFERNYNLYHLVLFSRKPLGDRFWREAMKFTSRQTDFGF